MKFAHDYTEALQKEEYPSQWVDCAISYRQLKKCIKNVRRELALLGLEPKTLRLLWQSSGASGVESSDNVNGVGFQYFFSQSSSSFRPKLTFVVDSRDGSPVDAFLSPETRGYLQQLATGQPVPLAELRSEQRSMEPTAPTQPNGQCGRLSENEEDPLLHSFHPSGSNGSLASTRRDSSTNDSQFHTIEIPLHSDSEFFQILRNELLNLERLQELEKRHLHEQIKELGQDIAKVSTPTPRRSLSALYAWREIFQLYTESQVFFSTGERDAGERHAASAQQQLESFQSSLHENKRVGKLGKSGVAALERFMYLNAVLLKNLKFQEINQLAFTKILKKFDKQTALQARWTFPQLLSADACGSFLADSIAKNICFVISSELVNVVPQLSDYTCPVCFSITFKPIRLRCNHVFCIRCMVLMQRAYQDHCPLCRQQVVLEASSLNLDEKLEKFLQATFPKETKAKQRENERAVAVDIYGEPHERCSVM